MFAAAGGWGWNRVVDDTTPQESAPRTEIPRARPEDRDAWLNLSYWSNSTRRHPLTPQERSRVHLAFAGAVDDRSRSYNQRLEELERTHRLGDHVSWLGARNDVPDLFAAADLAIHCSIKPEPFGLVVTEAMALGTPVAAARAGGPAEVVTPASGWLHDSARPEELGTILRSVLRDPGELARREEGARARAVEFSVVNTVAGTIAAYDRVMSGASRYQRFR